MEWIKSNEKEPLNEGKYHCKYDGINVVLDFVKIQPKKEYFILNEKFNNNLLEEVKYWTENINSSTYIKSHNNLVWLDEN
jgi:hypothetical protein